MDVYVEGKRCDSFKIPSTDAYKLPSGGGAERKRWLDYKSDSSVFGSSNQYQSTIFRYED